MYLDQPTMHLPAPHDRAPVRRQGQVDAVGRLARRRVPEPSPTRMPAVSAVRVRLVVPASNLGNRLSHGATGVTGITGVTPNDRKVVESYLFMGVERYEIGRPDSSRSDRAGRGGHWPV